MYIMKIYITRWIINILKGIFFIAVLFLLKLEKLYLKPQFYVIYLLNGHIYNVAIGDYFIILSDHYLKNIFFLEYFSLNCCIVWKSGTNPYWIPEFWRNFFLARYVEHLQYIRLECRTFVYTKCIIKI